MRDIVSKVAEDRRREREKVHDPLHDEGCIKLGAVVAALHAVRAPAKENGRHDADKLIGPRD